MRVLTVKACADRLGIAPGTLRDPRWRQRVGLPLTRIGRRVGFVEEDVERVIQRGRETVAAT